MAKWIDADKKMPKLGVRVLVCGKLWGPCQATAVVHEEKQVFALVMSKAEHDACAEDGRLVTHWCAMPKKPEID